MLKKMAAVVLIAAGWSWATPATANAKPITDAEATIAVRSDVSVRTYDLDNEADVAALIALVLGLDADVDVTAELD